MTTIFVCTTCRQPQLREDKPDPPCGETLYELVSRVAVPEPCLNVKPVACLMGCEHGCNVAISGSGKLSYVLGGFGPVLQDAESIAEYAVKHAGSESGVVPYREWPQGVKGHFISRIPPVTDAK